MAGPTLAIREQCPNATCNNDGLMSAEQACKLDSLTPGGGTNLAATYANGAAAVDQTILIAPANGGAVIVKANTPGQGQLFGTKTAAGVDLVQLTDEGATIIRSGAVSSPTSAYFVVDTLFPIVDVDTFLFDFRNGSFSRLRLRADGALELYDSGSAAPVQGAFRWSGAMQLCNDGVNWEDIITSATPQKDFLNQYFEGGAGPVPDVLTEIFRFTPDLGGLTEANLTVEYNIFSYGSGSSTLEQTIVYKVLGGTIFLAQAGAATSLGDGIVNSTVTIDGNDIVISMDGADEDTINVFTVVKCRVSNGSAP